MTEPPRAVPRVLVAAVVHRKGRAVEALAKMVADEVRGAGLSHVRTVPVNGERQYIQQLVGHVSNGNEADAIILVGGAGIGPHDDVCEAIDSFVDRRIEGFGEAFRQMLREHLGVGVNALLQRATAGVFNKCVVFALPRQTESALLAVRVLVIPTLAEAVRIAAQ